MSETVRSLAEFVAQLKAAEIVPLPQHGEWKEHVERISVPGRIAEVTEDDYDYWLEVLPPKYMRGSHFCFAEGAEAFRFFWQAGGRYFARQLTWEETVAFCRLAGINLPW
jgi:hypothetical protein